jgi:hypothetical protein
MPRPQRRLGTGFQKLENRTLLAGNVLAGPGEQVGELLIEGDLQDNAIAIWKDFGSGRFIVAGAKDSAGNPTLVNGQAAPQSVFGGATQIRLVMKGGNDTVLTTGLYTRDFTTSTTGVNIVAEMGAQNDKLIIRGDRPTTRQLFLNQDQADSIPYGSVRMTGNVTFIGNGGNDKLVATTSCSSPMSPLAARSSSSATRGTTFSRWFPRPRRISCPTGRCRLLPEKSCTATCSPMCS